MKALRRARARVKNRNQNPKNSNRLSPWRLSSCVLADNVYFDSDDDTSCASLSASGTPSSSPSTPIRHNRQREANEHEDLPPGEKSRDAIYRHYPFFELSCFLKEGRDLVIRDSCGTSDPYVKYKISGKLLHKSQTILKNLNPNWNEKFSLPIEDIYRPIQVRVYDYDKGLNDDYMGGADLAPTSLEPNIPTEIKLMLSDKSGKATDVYMGYISMQCTLTPRTQDEKEQYFKKGKTSSVSSDKKANKTQLWAGVVTIVLVEGHDLLPMDDNGFSDPYVKFRLGNEKYKSKYKEKTLGPQWCEQFDLHIYDMHTSQLEISVWDHDTAGKDDIMGRCVLELGDLKTEVTHDLDCELEDGAGFIRCLISVTATAGPDSPSDLSNYTLTPRQRDDKIIKYGLLNSLKDVPDVGWLQVKVLKAQGLAAADIGGKSDPFCVLELVNARLQTHTEYKTLAPEWGKIYTFNVKDIHAVLEITVYDEDRDKKCEFLGKIALPLLRMTKGCKRWYTLKDRKCTVRTKGAIQLELDFEYNHIKAAIRTVNPREEKYMQPEPKFKIAVMKRNIDRVTKIGEAAAEGAKFLQSCFDWESTPRSIAAFIVYLIIVWNFELFMVPVTLLVVFFKNLLVIHVAGHLLKDKEDDEYVEDDEEEEEDDRDKEEKKGFKEKLQQIQEVCLQVQEGMELVASGGERVKNTFNWTVPWLSWLAIIILSIATVVLYFIPVRYLLLAWGFANGINKFTKKLRAPNAVPNNELLDYLSRVPSDKELWQYRELRPDPGIGSMKKKRA